MTREGITDISIKHKKEQTMYGLIELQKRKQELMNNNNYTHHHLMTGVDGKKYNYFENAKNESFLYTIDFILVDATERYKLINV